MTAVQDTWCTHKVDHPANNKVQECHLDMRSLYTHARWGSFIHLHIHTHTHTHTYTLALNQLKTNALPVPWSHMKCQSRCNKQIFHHCFLVWWLHQKLEPNKVHITDKCLHVWLLLLASRESPSSTFSQRHLKGLLHEGSLRMIEVKDTINSLLLGLYCQFNHWQYFFAFAILKVDLKSHHSDPQGQFLTMD